MFQVLDEAHVDLNYGFLRVESLPLEEIFYKRSGLKIACQGIDLQVSSLVQVITSFFPSIYVVEDLYIRVFQDALEQWEDNTESMQWLEIFRPFTAVKNLYVCTGFVRCIAPALQGLVGERVTNVLPALECLYLEELDLSGIVQEAIGQFVATRQLLGHPVAVIYLNKT
jgi:hypothetical protein